MTMDIEGLFETILVRKGVPLLLPEHLRRLALSAKRLGLPDPGEVPPPELPFPDPGRMRIVLTAAGTRVTVTPFPGYPEEVYTSGAAALIAREPGHPLGTAAGHKVLPYEPCLKARERARERGALEMLFTDADGALLEGGASNLFLVRDGALLTPPLSRPILPGVTRAAAIRAARDLGLPVREENLFPEDVESAEGAFLTGSLMEVVPLNRLGEWNLPPWPDAAELRERLYG